MGWWCPTCSTFYPEELGTGVTLRQVQKDQRGRYLVRRKGTDPRFVVWASLILFTTAGLLGGAWASASEGVGLGLIACATLAVFAGPLWFMLLREDVSQVVLELRDEALIVRDPFGLNTQLPRSEIESLCVMCPAHNGSRTSHYAVVARLSSTDTCTIVGEIVEPGPALWLARELAADLKVEAATQPK